MNRLIGAALTVAGVVSFGSSSFYVGMFQRNDSLFLFSMITWIQTHRQYLTLFLWHQTLVPAGHRAVVFSRLSGVLEESKEEGLNFKIPWFQVCETTLVPFFKKWKTLYWDRNCFQYPYLYEIRTKYKNIQSTTSSKGILRLTISIKSQQTKKNEKKRSANRRS